MPIPKKVINAFERQYGKKKGKKIMYATENKHKKEGKGSFAKV